LKILTVNGQDEGYFLVAANSREKALGQEATRILQSSCICRSFTEYVIKQDCKYIGLEGVLV
jgi:hypothetical protein